jgi:glutaredoxin 2
MPGAPSSAAGTPTDPAVAGALVIEQFLRAVNASDLDTMARLFGTKEGPIVRLYDSKQVEDRMFVIARVLRHEDYTILRQEVVPGRREEATRVLVRMTIEGRQIELPYTLVWSNDRTWYIEQIPLEQVTGR